MFLKKKSRNKPIFKKYLKLRENIQNRSKLLKFKKKKWEKLISYYIKRTKKYNRYKPQDQYKYTVSKFTNRWNSYKKKFVTTASSTKKFRTFYGNIKKTKLKTILHKETKNSSLLTVVQTFEKRLEMLLYRSKFCRNVKTARQLIIHGKIYLNNKKITSPSYILNCGDFIKVCPSVHKFIRSEIRFLNAWPIPPKYLTINYKTLEFFVGKSNLNSYSTSFPFHLNLEKILVSYKYY